MDTVQVMPNEFHAEIAIDEFCYALNIWSAAVSGKLHVAEVQQIPEGDTACIDLHLSSGKTIQLFKKKGDLSLPAFIAIAKEFSDFSDKCVSILLHCLIFEKILLNPIFDKYVNDFSIYKRPCLTLIKDLPIKIGEEDALNHLNMDYILEKFKQAAL